MLGAILGDIIGSRFEFSNTAINKDFKINFPGSRPEQSIR